MRVHEVAADGGGVQPAHGERREAADPAASLWRSRFRYRTARFADDVARKGCGERSVVINGLSDEIYRYIDRYRGNYRIALTNFFYTRRQ